MLASFSNNMNIFFMMSQNILLENTKPVVNIYSL